MPRERKMFAAALKWAFELSYEWRLDSSRAIESSFEGSGRVVSGAPAQPRRARGIKKNVLGNGKIVHFGLLARYVDITDTLTNP
jgi:hypothetical protein